MESQSRNAPHAGSLRAACAAGGMGILAALVLTSCSPKGLEPIPFKAITSGSTPVSGEISTSRALAYQIIADSTAWSDFWRRSFAAPLPELRFEDEFVLRVEWGTRPTGGYGIEIRDLRLDRKSGTLYVGLDLQEPRPDDMVTQMLTAPFAVVRVRLPRAVKDRALLAVRFSRLAGTKRQELEARRLEATSMCSPSLVDISATSFAPGSGVAACMSKPAVTRSVR